MDHIWFKGVDWNAVKKKEIPPPWVPDVQSKTDFSHFDNYPDSGEQIITPSPNE